MTKNPRDVEGWARIPGGNGCQNNYLPQSCHCQTPIIIYSKSIFNPILPTCQITVVGWSNLVKNLLFIHIRYQKTYVDLHSVTCDVISSIWEIL